MKAAFVLSSLSRANGGISESVRRLAQSLLKEAGAQVDVLGLRDAHTDADLPLWQPLQPQAFEIQGPRALGYSNALLPALHKTQAEVSHVAGLWMYPSIANARWSGQTGRPYVISPHGMLDAWALRNSAWKKTLAARLFERQHLERAACLHALCAAEAESLRAYGLANPICVLPNGIDLPTAPPASRPAPWAGRFPDNRRVLLFLGRLHPKKGLSPLLQAWDQARPAGWQLVIAGWDQGGHQRELELYVAAHNLGDSVHFPGPLHGEAKAAAYQSAHAFILPSFSEGLPMTVLEAWAHGLPVLMTPACNLPEGFTAGSALEIGTDPGMLASALTDFLKRGPEEHAAMGRRGIQLASQQFNWGRIAREMAAVYRWINGQGGRPECVRV